MSEVLVGRSLTLTKGEKTLLDQQDMVLHQGDFVLLTGDTGAGKSSLFQLLSGLGELAYTGELTIGDQPVSQLTLAQRLRLTGVLFQNPSRQFTMKTLRRELAFALSNLGLDWAMSQERQAEACHLTGTEPLLDQPLTHLSGGEKQRAALAVLLAMNTPIFLLDEPFASVDGHSRARLLLLLGDLAKAGKTIILSDHDLTGYAGLVSRHWHLAKGQLIEKAVADLPAYQTYQLTQAGPSPQPLFTCLGLSKTISSRLLWEMPDFTFPTGLTTLTGDNGTGKSTLLRAMAQLTPYQGKMSYQGQVLKKSSAIYKNLTLTVQSALQQFVTLMPRDELAFCPEQWPDAKDWQERVIAATSLREVMGVSLMALSGGQQKLIQLMAMLSQRVPFLMMDEPFSGLDQAACQLVVDWMVSNQARYGQSILVVSHRLAPLDGVSQHHLYLANHTLSLVGEGGQS